ncbi:AI-2E family transporter [Virgibacillus sp. NKC19-16]|uniref:AI-2E family transporter n=1 Tax=Virgibacillus salidurans TaxID=2831673 RepID=UPI001F3FD0B8|nr:AI-2E family transporter [Virgibacillus sp. NKC19-16]UJL47201.1 AI-2E family transporter [Virgibacillus sp. NKC19-16]
MNRWETSPFFRFFGGKNLLYLFALLLLIGLNILIFTEVSFIFEPIVVLFGTIALPSILAIIAYYLLRPVVRLMGSYGVKRGLAILIVFIALSGLLALLIFLIVPFLQRQITSLMSEFPQYIAQMGNSLDQWLRSSMFAGYYENLSANIDGVFQTILDNLSTYIGDTIEGVTGFISQVAAVVIAIVTVPFILFYLLKEGEKFPRRIIQILPPRLRSEFRRVFDDIDHQLSSYIVGQILVSLSIGVMMYIGFVIIGLEYSLLLAAIACVTNFVPYLGPAIAITPALIIAAVTSPFMFFKLIIVWTIVQLLEGKLISPQIMGKRLHVHPITIIFVLLTAGNLFGVIGILLAIPGYAVLKVVVSHLFILFKRRHNRYAEKDNQYEIQG